MLDSLYFRIVSVGGTDKSESEQLLSPSPFEIFSLEEWSSKQSVSTSLISSSKGFSSNSLSSINLVFLF